MKPLLITAALALAAPLASAGDFSFHLGIGKSRKGKSVRVGVGYRDSHHRGGHVKVAVRKHRDHGYRRGHRYGHRRGHYEYVKRRVWVPGYYEKVYHPAEYRYRYDRCGRRIKVITLGRSRLELRQIAQSKELARHGINSQKEIGQHFWQCVKDPDPVHTFIVKLLLKLAQTFPHVGFVKVRHKNQHEPAECKNNLLNVGSTGQLSPLIKQGSCHGHSSDGRQRHTELRRRAPDRGSRDHFRAQGPRQAEQDRRAPGPKIRVGSHRDGPLAEAG